ncbi:hypothetical protein C0993_009852 [Termitomyces sp. T159_Od127]|nr:hypothetical protein C0993_009852 [Termitomyces sp. T159_Od127]
MVVVLKLGIWKQLIPVVLPLIAEEAEVLLQFLVHVFCLPIRLEMVGGGGVEFHIEKLVELPGKLCYKLWAPVQHIGIQEAMELPDILLVQVCGTHGGAGGVGRDEVHSLATEIHHYYDGIIAVSVREFQDVGYIDAVPEGQKPIPEGPFISAD